MTKAKAPETASQAQTWEKVKNKALAFGLCHRCASQIAWGHQNGFTGLQPPCLRCIPLLSTLPNEKSGGWRTVGGSAGHVDWPSKPSVPTFHPDLSRPGTMVPPKPEVPIYAGGVP